MKHVLALAVWPVIIGLLNNDWQFLQEQSFWGLTLIVGYFTYVIGISQKEGD